MVGELAPMVVTDNAWVFAYLAEAYFTNTPFAVLMRETRGCEIRDVPRGAGQTLPYSDGPQRP